MPNDAKFGLAVGVGLVIVFAVLFFRKEITTAQSPPEGAATAVKAARPAPVPRGLVRPVRTRPTSQVGTTAKVAVASRQHTVVKGDTLFQLAIRYYGDGDRFFDLYQANRDQLRTPDALPMGSVLRIPELADEPATTSVGNAPR